MRHIIPTLFVAVMIRKMENYDGCDTRDEINLAYFSSEFFPTSIFVGVCIN